jgi:energy-coupling factor transporter ATP-binding protein EcfA2
MKVLSLTIDGFRGITHASITFGDHTVIVGPNGSGKSTIIDALSLVFGRTRLVRDLTEHDFLGSYPEATSRLRIVATIGGFQGNDPERHDTWFREGRAVPKWWCGERGEVLPEPESDSDELCAQIGFSARFDLEELVVEQIRYFHDDDTVEDVFQEDAVQTVPHRLLDDIGYYVLPARRTWEAAVSFASELFRKAVATVGGIPAETILDERNRLRRPESPLEDDPGLRPLVDRINGQLALLLPQAPQFQLRVTATDSDSLLRALVPHYRVGEDVSLPVGRHGTGLLSLQTFILLLELGRERRSQGRPFMLAMEEPELHVPPGLQRRLVARAVSVAEQTICTSHSPRVASFYPATSVQILEHRPAELASTPLLATSLGGDASNAVRKLYHDDRPRVIEALMHHRVLIPEGRSEFEWFRLLVDVLETGDRALSVPPSDIPPFGAIVGVVPTHESAVAETYERLRPIRDGLVPVVDGDNEGDNKLTRLCSVNPPPGIVLQWRDSWTIEDVVGWILNGDEDDILAELKARIDVEFVSIDELIELFKVKTGSGRLKTNYLAYQEIAAVIGGRDGCVGRAKRVLEAVTLACLGRHEECNMIETDDARSSEHYLVLRVLL